MNCKTSQVKLPKGTFQQEKTRTTPSGSGTTCAVAGQAISGTRTCMRSPTQRRQRATVAEEETITGLLEHYVPVACLLRGHPFAELLQRAVGGLDEHPDLAKPEKTQPNRPERPRQCRSIHQTEAKANKEKENGDGVHGLLATGRDLVPVRLGVVLAEVLVERLERLHLLLLEEPEEAPQLRLPPR